MFPPLCSPLVLGVMGPLLLAAIHEGAAALGLTNREYVRERDGVLSAKASVDRGPLPDHFSGPLSPTGLRMPHRPIGPPRAYFVQQVCLGKNRARERYQEALDGVLREPDQDPQQMLESLAHLLPHACSSPSFCPWAARLDADYGPKMALLRGEGKPSIFHEALERCSSRPVPGNPRSTEELRSCLAQEPRLDCLEELASADWKLAREIASGLPASTRPELREAAQTLAQFEGREPLRRWLIERRFLLEADPLEPGQERRALGVPAVLVESGQATDSGFIEELWSVLWPGQDLTVEAEAPPDSMFCTDETSSFLFARRGDKNFTLFLVDERNSAPCSHVPDAMLIPAQIGFLNSVALETKDTRRLIQLRNTKPFVRDLFSLVIAAPPESLREARTRGLIDSPVALQPAAEGKEPKGSP